MLPHLEMPPLSLTENFSDIYEGVKWKDRLDPVESVTDMEMYVPWFLACNPDRFPYWFGRREPRNKLLHEVLQKFLDTTDDVKL